MNNEESAFMVGVGFAIAVCLLANVLIYGTSFFTQEEITKKLEQCKQANSVLKKLYFNDDIECENGAKF